MSPSLQGGPIMSSVRSPGGIDSLRQDLWDEVEGPGTTLHPGYPPFTLVMPPA